MAPADSAVQEKLGGLAGSAEFLDTGDGEAQALRRASESEADYLLKINDPSVGSKELEQALSLAGSKELVIGRGMHNGFSGFMMRLVYTYSFRIFLKCGVPSFLLIRRDRLDEYMENSPADIACPDAVLIASACYAHAAVGTVECAGDGGCAAQTASRVFGRVFHSLKTFKQLDLRLRERYGEYKPEDGQKEEMGAFDKLLGIAHRG